MNPGDCSDSLEEGSAHTSHSLRASLGGPTSLVPEIIKGLREPETSDTGFAMPTRIVHQFGRRFFLLVGVNAHVALAALAAQVCSKTLRNPPSLPHTPHQTLTRTPQILPARKQHQGHLQMNRDSWG